MKREQDKREFDEVAGRIEDWQENNPTATLTEMEKAIDEEMNQLRSEIMKRLVRERESQEETKQVCPNCRRNMVKNGKRKRRLTTKGGEEIEYERQQMRCSHCGMTLFPPR